jgi:hypothetical protein
LIINFWLLDKMLSTFVHTIYIVHIVHIVLTIYTICIKVGKILANNRIFISSFILELRSNICFTIDNSNFYELKASIF